MIAIERSYAFSKGSQPKADTPKTSPTPTATKSLAQSQRRKSVVNLSSPEKRDIAVNAWNGFSVALLRERDLNWAEVVHLKHTSELYEHVSALFHVYQWLDGESRSIVADACGWDYVPKPVGEVSLVEWIIFMVSTAYAQSAGRVHDA